MIGQLSTANKAITAALGGIVAWGATAQSGGITPIEWWGLAAVLVNAFLVWFTPNAKPDTIDIAERLGE